MTIINAINNTGYTLNGATTLTSTLNANLDFFAQAGAMRGQNNRLIDLFEKAYRENKLLAILNLFHLRDVRGGKGERSSFRVLMEWVNEHDRNTFNTIFHLIPQYGRWDDLLIFVDNDEVVNYVAFQLDADTELDHISLLGKWMPSEGSANDKLAKQWMNALGLTPRAYRKLLSKLRAKLNIVEKNLSQKQYHLIEYQAVPSYAMKRYRKAFSKNDPNRFSEYMAAVQLGKAKINSSVMYPYDFIREMGKYDATLQAQWDALPDFVDGNFLVVCDVSGSMAGMPIQMSIGLGLYTAERNKGYFKDHLITFETTPKLVKVSGNLQERYKKVALMPWGGSTNLQAVFDLVLKAACTHNLSEEDMPKAILIISDMEFDQATEGKTNYQAIERKYRDAGYDIPLLVFWNVNSKQNNVAVSGTQKNTMLVSGSSVHTFKSVCALKDNIPTPLEVMHLELYGSRYEAVRSVLGI